MAADFLPLNPACLLVLCFSICHTYFYGVSLSAVPVGLMPHYIGQAFWSQAECWHGSFVIFQWIQTSIAKELKSSLMFQGVGLDPLFPHLDPRMNSPIVTVMVILTLFYDQWKSDWQVSNSNGGPGIFLSVKTDFI